MTETDEYLPVPQPDELTQKEKDDAMGAYLMMFAAWAVGLPLPFINIIASVIYYFVNRDKGNFVLFHTLQSMWSQILVGILNAVLVFWLLAFVFSDLTVNNLFWGFLINLLYTILSIWAAARARKGRFLYFFFFGKLAFHLAYSVERNERRTKDYSNAPPKL